MFHRKPRLAVLLLSLLPCSLLPAQTVPGGEEAASSHTSTLGTKYVAVPGTTVLVSIWETKVSEWTEFLRERKYPWSFQPHFTQTPEHPVVGVNLQDAVAFCNWLTETEREKKVLNSSQSYRLPTPDEWDAAVGLARGRKKTSLTADEKMRDDRVYPWGDSWPPSPKTANLAEGEILGHDDGYAHTAPVGSFPPSAEGIYDLSGNVWEWTQPIEIRATPTGVLRGGSWAYFRPECLASGYQYVVPLDLRAPTIGFRVVFDDKRRTASLLAASDVERKKEMEERMKALAENRKVDSGAVEELRKKMQTKTGPALPDVASLKPAAADGSTFMNALGMRFVPLGENSRVLVCATETSVDQFEAWLTDARRTWKKPSFLLGGTHPAAGVSWEEATAFCTWLTDRDRASKLIPPNASYRLPRDLEWSTAAGLKDEKGADPAARHLADKTHYPWTPLPNEWKPPMLTANLDATKIGGISDSFSYTAPVDSSRPNALGLHEMGGNVAEWCEDAWPGAAEERVIRGGSWLGSDKEALLTSARTHALKTSTRTDLGFRCVLDLGTP